MNRPEPTVGMAAAIHLPNDSVAAVVVRVNKKSISVRAVETGDIESVKVAGPWPVSRAIGILDKPFGQAERYNRYDTPDGPAFRCGTIGLSLGKSVSVTDHRY